MELLELSKRAVRLVYTSRALWLFGIFAGTGAGGAGGGGKSKPVSLGGHELPGWLLPVIAAGVVVAIAALLMHLVSEGALIIGVRRRLDGEAFGVGRGFKEGRRFIGRVLAIELASALAIALVAAVAALPAVGIALHLVPLAAGLIALVPLLAVAVPAMLTVYMMRQWGLRAAVLNDLRFGQAVAAARAEVRGRLLDSLQLMLLEFVGQLGGAALAFAVAIPGAVVGVVVGLIFGLIPGIVTGAALASPLLLAAVGVSNAFRSAIWTLGFLDGKNERVTAA